MLVTEIGSLKDCCTGCFACANVCSRNAISMPLNSEGFFFPVIDKKLCVNCGKCEKVCQISHKRIMDTLGKMYSFQSEDSIRMKSSSGGAFYHLAQSVLKNDGVVYGAAYNPNEKRVCHMSTDSVSLEALMRSKYVQSDIGETYRKIKDSLNKGRKVLFVGTPCHIHGLLNFLGKDYANLVTVDFVCHGVPSPGFLSDVILYYENQEKSAVVDVTFREKDLGWRDQVTKIYFNITRKIFLLLLLLLIFAQLYVTKIVVLVYKSGKSCFRYNCDGLLAD